LGEASTRGQADRWLDSRLYWLLLSLFVGLQIADIITTNYALAIPGIWEANATDGVVTGHTRCRVVAAETRDGRLPMCRGVILEQAMAHDLRGIGFRRGGARQPHSPLNPIVPNRGKITLLLLSLS
jgi:hypothetical protein